MRKTTLKVEYLAHLTMQGPKPAFERYATSMQTCFTLFGLHSAKMLDEFKMSDLDGNVSILEKIYLFIGLFFRKYWKNWNVMAHIFNLKTLSFEKMIVKFIEEIWKKSTCFCR